MESSRYIFKTEQKALEINLNDKLYGTFAEIGAGQEVARNFFQAGGAAGTIAKTMSAYDKTYSDAIYGVEEKSRYVCESRVYKMLDHEYDLMEDRLQPVRPETNFFVFADTVAAINYNKTIKGNGWLGVRFQLDPYGKPNELVLHAKMLDQDNKLQQEAIGVLGVNMIFACFFYKDNMDYFIHSLIDGIENRVSIDMVSLNGTDFKHVDNRLLAMYLVKYNLTDVTMFDEKGLPLHASEWLYKKAVMVVRGHYRPPTLVTEDVFSSGFKQFIEDADQEADRCALVAELTMENLTRDGMFNDEDFIARADMLCAMGHCVIVSDCSNHQNLINYLSDFKIKKLGLVIGARELLEIIEEKYEQNQDGRLLVAFGELFTRNIKIYVYPASDLNGDELMTAHNLPVPEGIRFLYQHLLNSEHVVEVKHYDPTLLHIMPYNVLQNIIDNEDWEKHLPEAVASVIKKKSILGYQKPIN